jgi:NAD(P)-dependent dehydrogenase (short-subunit alcohol dehydrogenase family)
MRLRDKVAVITGAGSGFGRATAARFAEEGARVVIADVNESGAEETAALARGTEAEAEVVVADIATRDGAHELVARARDRFGGVDILVNNAGISQREGDDTWDCDDETWDEIIRVDLKSVYLCTKAAVPSMLERGRGSVVNITSIAAACRIGGAAYAAAKAGILGYTCQVAGELADRNVRVNCVSPGLMRTPMSTGERKGLSPEQQEERIAGFGKLVPMRRAGMPTDIAEAVLYLASDEAGYVTGRELVVDGGYLVR